MQHTRISESDAMRRARTPQNHHAELIKQGFEKLRKNLKAVCLDDGETLQDFDKLLTTTGSLIAGGFVLRSFSTQDHSGIFETGGDLDIYVKNKHAIALMAFFQSIGLSFVFQNMAPPYDESFFRKNKIISRTRLETGDRKINLHDHKSNLSCFSTKRDPTVCVDLMIVPDDVEPKSVVTNFDLTFCEIWYDGKTVQATDMNGVLNKTGRLRKEYTESLLVNMNPFLTRRINKYKRRGFKIEILPKMNKYIIENVKERQVESMEAWLTTVIYKFMLQTRTTTESATVRSKYTLEKLTKWLWQTMYPLRERTFDALEGIAMATGEVEHIAKKFNEIIEPVFCELNGDKCTKLEKLTDLQKYYFVLCFCTTYDGDLDGRVETRVHGDYKGLPLNFDSFVNSKYPEAFSNFIGIDWNNNAQGILKIMRRGGRTGRIYGIEKDFQLFELFELGKTAEQVPTERYTQLVLELKHFATNRRNVHPIFDVEPKDVSEIDVDEQKMRACHDVLDMYSADEENEELNADPSILALTDRIQAVIDELNVARQKQDISKIRDLMQRQTKLVNERDALIKSNDTTVNTTGSVLLSKYFKERTNIVIVIGDDMICYEYDNLLNSIRDKNLWMYECEGDFISDSRDKKIVDVHADAPVYVGIPINTDGMLAYVDAGQIHTLLNMVVDRGVQIFHFKDWRTITHSISHRNTDYFNADWVSANHCQHGSALMLYTVQICSGEHCAQRHSHPAPEAPDTIPFIIDWANKITQLAIQD